MVKADWILLIEAWTGRRITLDIRDTDAGEMFVDRVTTDRVHQISETDRTADVYLDALTVLPRTPATNTVLVLPGQFQLYEKIIKIDTPMESPAIPMIQPKDCDPSVVAPIRWSILCVREHAVTGEHRLIWSHGKPDGNYPEIPYNCVPIALVKVGLGLVKVEHQDILTWRSVKPGYDPDAKYWLAPVKDVESLYEKYDGEYVPEGAQVLVLAEAKNYYWENGEWHSQTLMPFDNTIFIVDLTEPTLRVDLPWMVTDPIELAVFRDGQYVCQGQEYDFVTYAGPAAYLLFNRILLPGQRIVVLRNPFLSASGGGGGDGALPIGVVDIWVDGEIGTDAWDGSELHPFKTLQRGFDACSVISNNVYRVHARRLKLADVITDDSDHTCFGWIKNLRAQGLMIEIENDCEWDTNVVEYAYVLYSSAVVQYVTHPVYYRFLHIEVIASFADVEIFDGGDIYGGYTAFNDCQSAPTQANALTLYAAGATEMHNSSIKQLEMNSNAILRAYYSDFENVAGVNGGILDMYWCHIRGTALFENAALILTNTTVEGKGSFWGGYVRATFVEQKTGTGAMPATSFFVGSHGCNMDFDHVDIDFIEENGIYLRHGSSIYIEESSIHNCGLNGIRLTHGSHIEAVNTDISNCSVSGIRMELGSYGAFKDCYGYGSSRYGIECSGFSRGERDNTVIWGGLGDYYELVPGSDTVISDRDDLVPGTLDEKIRPGTGMYTLVVPSTALPSDRKFEIGIDLEKLTAPDIDGNVLLNLAPYCHVFKRTTPIVEPGTGAVPDPNSYVDYSLKWEGEGYLSSVLRRISDPAVQTKLVLTDLANADNFVQMDQWRGTEFVSDGLTLKNYPILGYPVDRPYFVIAKPYLYGSLAGLNVAILQHFDLDVDAPLGTDVKVGFSINGGATWLTWDNVNFEWSQLDGESTLIALQGAPSYTEIPPWHPDAWERLRQMNGISITVGFLLSSNSPSITPKVKSYSWTYVEDGYWLDISEHFEKTFYAGRTVFKYKGTLGPVIDPPLVFTVYPLRNRE